MSKEPTYYRVKLETVADEESRNKLVCLMLELHRSGQVKWATAHWEEVRGR